MPLSGQLVDEHKQEMEIASCYWAIGLCWRRTCATLLSCYCLVSTFFSPALLNKTVHQTVRGLAASLPRPGCRCPSNSSPSLLSVASDRKRLKPAAGRLHCVALPTRFTEHSTSRPVDRALPLLSHTANSRRHCRHRATNSFHLFVCPVL